MVRTTSLIFTSVALLASYVNAFGMIAQVVNSKNFCVLLPPNNAVDRLISDNEWDAQAFCQGKTPKATNAGKLPTGFIKSAHYVQTPQYVQITGQMDIAKAKLNATDEGGQFDIKAPKGSSCAGWLYYVNIIEPAGGTYCMRCCNDTTNCNRGISQKGCAHVIPGDYSASGFTNSKGPGNNATVSTTTSTSKYTSATQTSSHGTQNTTKTTPAATTAATTTSGTKPMPIVAADKNDGSSSTTTSQVATTPLTSASPSSAAVPASASPHQMLSQNESVTGQSVSAADSFRPSMTAFAAVLIVIAMMN